MAPHAVEGGRTAPEAVESREMLERRLQPGRHRGRCRMTRRCDLAIDSEIFRVEEVRPVRLSPLLVSHPCEHRGSLSHRSNARDLGVPGKDGKSEIDVQALQPLVDLCYVPRALFRPER